MKPRNQFDNSEDGARASALVTLVYVTMSIANAYLEECNDILEEYGLFTFDTKKEAKAAIKRFEDYHKAMMKYLHGEPMMQKQIIDVYEGVKAAIDSQVLETSIEQYKQTHQAHEQHSNNQRLDERRI